MMKSKKILAIVLATSMMLGSSITALADGATGTTGAGRNEGHVEKEVINVVLPTIADGSTPFAYTMDPERLITATNGAAHSGATFPSSNDTGVYFQTETNTYANTSNELTITNKSSCDVDITVKVKAVANDEDKDIALAEDSTVSTTEGSPNLYLGLKVGTDTTTVKTEEQTVTKTIEGIADNFEIVYDTTYKYQEKASASGWKDLKISMTGAVSEMDVPEGTTAPTISVTWSFAKHTDAYVSSTNISSSTNSVALSLPQGVTIQSVALYKASAPTTPIALSASNQYTVSNNNFSVPANMLTAWGAGSKIKITYSDDHIDELTIQ